MGCRCDTLLLFPADNYKYSILCTVLTFYLRYIRNPLDKAMESPPVPLSNV